MDPFGQRVIETKLAQFIAVAKEAVEVGGDTDRAEQFRERSRLAAERDLARDFLQRFRLFLVADEIPVHEIEDASVRRLLARHVARPASIRPRRRLASDVGRLNLARDAS